MKLFLDSSDPDVIKSAIETGLVDGVTTNPTLMARQGQDPIDVIYRISELFSWTASVSVEVMGDTAEEMLDMAVDYYQIAPNVTIKLPCTRQGLLACADLAQDGIKTNVTLIFSAAQAILAAKAGATYISPFVGRLHDQYWDGISLVRQINTIYEMHDVQTEILAASIRTAPDVVNAFAAGADICTVPLDVFWKMYDHTLTDSGLKLFQRDWESLNMELNDGSL